MTRDFCVEKKMERSKVVSKSEELHNLFVSKYGLIQVLLKRRHPKIVDLTRLLDLDNTNIKIRLKEWNIFNRIMNTHFFRIEYNYKNRNHDKDKGRQKKQWEKVDTPIWYTILIPMAEALNSGKIFMSWFRKKYW